MLCVPWWLADFWQHTSAPEDEVEPANNKKESVGMGNEKNSTESTVHDTDAYLQSLIATNPLQESIFRRAIHTLNLLQGSRGLDVGYGIGLQVMLLSEAVGPMPKLYVVSHLYLDFV